MNSNISVRINKQINKQKNKQTKMYLEIEFQNSIEK